MAAWPRENKGEKASIWLEIEQTDQKEKWSLEKEKELSTTTKDAER